MRLHGGRAAQPQTSRAQIPEIAPDEALRAFSLARFVGIVERRRKRGVSRARGLPEAEACSHRARHRYAAEIETFDGSLVARLRHMAERACLVAIDGKFLVVEQHLAQGRQALRASRQE